jgi:hypothetical protein
MIVSFLQSGVGRMLRIVVGLLIVGFSVYQSLLLSVALLIIGVAIATFGAAGVCPVAELLFGKSGPGGRTRASHA